MFYSQFILAKKGPLGTIWIAAHLERKLKKNQVAETDITDSVDSILFPDVPIALRLSSHLLLGVVRIYSKKVNYLFHDCSETLLKVKQAFRSTAVDLPPEESTAPYHSITLPETFDLDDFELPDTVGNFDDRNVSTKEQITLQDALDGAGFSDLQFGLDERFGDGDASQIGLDFDEEFLRDSNLVFQQVKEGVFQHGEGSSDIIKVNDNEEQAIRDKENNDAYSNELSKLLGGDRGKNVITNIQNVNKSDEFSHRLMFNIRTPDLNEVFMPDNECIGGPSGTHDVDMDPTSPVFNEHNNLPITPMVQEAACADAANDNIPNAMSTNPELDSVVSDKPNSTLNDSPITPMLLNEPNSTLNDSPITPMVQEVKCANAANDNILNATLMNQESNIVLLNEPNSTLNDSPITPMVQEVKCANAANDDILNATLMNQESNTVLLNEPNSTLNELSTTHIVQEVQCADAANDNILNAISTKPESDNVVLNEPNNTANDSKNAEDTSIPIPVTVADPKLADGHVGSAVANPGLVEKETDSAAATALPNGVCSEESSHVVSSVNDMPTLNHAQIGDANSVQTNHISFLNSDFHLKSCTSVSSQANFVSPDEPCCSVAPTVDKDIRYREFTTSMQGPCSDIAINRNAEAQPKLNDVQPQQLNHLPSSEAPEPEKLLFTPTVNFTSSNDQNMQFSQGSPSNMAINTNTVAQLKLSDVQVDQLNYLQSSEAPQPERLSFTPAVNFTLSNDQNMHFSPGPPSNIAAINTNTVAQPKLNNVQLDQLNPIPGPEAPEKERLSFTPAVNFIPSSDQNVHFSQGPSNIAINTNSEARSTSNNVQLDQLNHLPSPEVPAPEILSFTPAVNFNPSNDQNMHFSQGPSNISINTNAEAQTTLNNVQLDQLNNLPSSEAPVPERLSFTPAVNFTPSNDQNMHFSQGPSSIAINTNSEAQPKLNNVQLDQLNHLPRSEAPAPERLLFTPAGNFTPSNDQHMPFSQGMHFTQGMPFSKGMHFSQGMQFSQDMHFRGPSTSIPGYPSDNATVRNRETLAQPKSNEHINQLNYLSNSQFSEPERMLFAPSVNYFASNDKEKQPVNKGVIEFDGSVDRTGTLSGKKRPLIDNTPYIQNDTSFNGSSILQKRQHNDYIIPQDDDLLASILVGRTPALKVGPSPPIPKPPTSKRPRLTQKSGLPKRRKVLLDDPIVLHADTIRQQLINTDDIHRLRKKVPCTIPEIWRLQRNLLEEGEEEKDIFGGSLFTGISQELISLNTRKYASAKRLPEQGVSHDSTIKAIKEFGGNKSPVSVMDNNGPETVTPSIDLLERVNVPEIVTSNVEVSERVNVSEIVTPNVEMSESVNVSEIVIPNMEMPESVNVSEIVAPNMEVSERVEVSEIVAPNMEVSERVEVSEIVAPDVEVSERVEVSEIVAPDVEVSERVEVSEMVAPNVEVSERVNMSEMVTPNVERSEIVTPNVEGSERVNVSEIVTPNVEGSERVNVSEMVTPNVERSEIVTPNVEGSERVNVSEIVTPVVEVPERVEIPELIGTENCNNLLSIETHEPHDVDLPESNTSNTEFGDTVMEENCDEVNNDLLLGAPDMPVSVNDDMPHRADLSNDKVTEVTVEDMAVDVVNMTEVGNEFKEYASYIVGEANSLDPDPHVTEGEHAASAMDKNLSVNVEAGLDVGNNHIEHEPTKESNENLSVNVETGLSVDSNHTEYTAIKEPDVNLSGNVETAPDVDTNDIEQAATKESDDFDDDMDNIDTGFLNVDDDVEYEEDTTTDVQNAEDAQSLETVGWSARTRGVANYLKIMFDQESGRGRKSVAIDQLLAGKTRKEASRMFFETLVLKTRDYIQVEQEKPYAYINVQPRMKLLKSEF